MLESAELGHSISKRDFDHTEPKLREALVNAQYDLLEGRRKAVVVLLSGVAAGGRGETAKQLAEWMDPRHLRVEAFGPRTPEELVAPAAMALLAGVAGARAHVAVYMNAWYAETLQARLRATRRPPDSDAFCTAIREYERCSRMKTCCC